MSHEKKTEQFGITTAYQTENDGVDHINIYSRGNTQLGRRLSNFAYVSFDHPFFGKFSSMEGFWYYIRNGCQDEELRNLSGLAAKHRGRLTRGQYQTHFRDDIIGGIYQKIIQNEHLLNEFVASTLPFTHYYVMAEPDKTTTQRSGNGGDWTVDGLETMRREMKENKVPAVWERCAARYDEIKRNLEQKASFVPLDFNKVQSTNNQPAQLLRKPIRQRYDC